MITTFGGAMGGGYVADRPVGTPAVAPIVGPRE
jgi:hypothetical protein